MDVSGNRDIIGSGKGLSLTWHQAITQTNANLLATGLQEQSSGKFES